MGKLHFLRVYEPHAACVQENCLGGRWRSEEYHAFADNEI
ncbi:hypothetical protein OKW39_001928 [Paraburkholderia sp. MM6662-R1]